MKKFFTLALLQIIICHFAQSQTTHIDGPVGSVRFGYRLLVLPNGNYVVVDHEYTDGITAGIGAVHLYNGSNHTIISTFKGKYFNDRIGIDGLKLIPNSNNFLVISSFCNNGVAFGVGAVTFINGNTGLNAEVSAANSLMGSVTGDAVGEQGVTILANGDYVVRSRNCDNGLKINAGAFTLCNGTTGTTGIVSTANSLMGNSDYDFVGIGLGSGNTGNPVIELPNGNIVLFSNLWRNGAVADAGAVTFINRSAPIVGVVTAANSLVGTKAQDFVGKFGCTILSNNNFVVSSVDWDNGVIDDAGAATWVSGTTGLTGAVSASNSLVGNNIGDRVSEKAQSGPLLNGIYALPNGNYVVCSFRYGSGIGAAIYCNGNTGTSGGVASSNPFVGTFADVRSVSQGGVRVLPNGNYVLVSNDFSQRSAVTWFNGTTGTTIDASQNVTLLNSLRSLGTNNLAKEVVVLPNSNYVVVSPLFQNGAIPNAGAITLCGGNGTTVGLVSSANSFVGSNAFDQIGKDGVAVLANGNFVFGSSLWDNGATTNAGAVTFCKKDFTGSYTGILSSANSLVGNVMSQQLGSNITGGTSTNTNVYSPIIPLPNGNYIVQNDRYTNGAADAAGAVVWCNGTTGRSGNITNANALVGSTTADYIGSNGIVVLPNSNYIVSSPSWDDGAKNGAGAITFCNGDGTTTGAVNINNSVIGNFGGTGVGGGGMGLFLSNNLNSTAPQEVSLEGYTNYHIQKLGNGNYIVGGDAFQSQLNYRGFAYGNSTTGITGYFNTCNGLTPPSQGASSTFYQYDSLYNFMIVSRPSQNKISYFKPLGMVLASTNVSVTRNYTGQGLSSFISSNCQLIASLVSTGASPIKGSITAKVWLQPAQPALFVKRHYEITPAVNASTATGNVTLYFTQQEFNDYNAVNAIALPTAPNDNSGIANLLVEKRGGTSSDNSGLPNTYSGTITTINPADNDVVWNAIENRWEITFPVTGFSGFFVKTSTGVLPIQWLQVQGKLLPSKLAQINWKVAENNITTYEIEKANAANIFEKIGMLTSKGNGENDYSFTDNTTLVGTGLYRIKQVDVDGKINYSTIVKLSAVNDKQIQAYPNPVEDLLTVTLNYTNIKNTTAQMLTIDGKMLTTQKVNSQVFTINTSALKTGVYVLQIIHDGEVFTQQVVKK
jgi:Repeat of unknown function (DUF5650)/Secretion system C-terminal sorting domain